MAGSEDVRSCVEGNPGLAVACCVWFELGAGVLLDS